MQYLEPSVGKVLEGNVTPGEFLQFFHKGGRPVRLGPCPYCDAPQPPPHNPPPPQMS